jgi:hypothetical protein
VIVFLIIPLAILFIFFVIAILDHFNITHILMKKRGSGSMSAALRAAQDAFEPSAKQAHEVIMEEQEKKDDHDISDSGPGKDIKG